MLERDGNPNVSRRWGWAVALVAAALIPMQLVARTPAAAPQENAKQQELIKAAQAAERSRADVERAKAVLAKAELEWQLEKKLTEANAREIEAKVTEQDRARLEIASAMARIAEKAHAQAGQTDQANRTFAEVIAQLEKARQAQRDAAADQEAGVFNKQTEALKLSDFLKLMLEKEKVQKEDLASQIRRLAERLERIAMEQRELTEELKQLERLAAPTR